MPYPDKPLSGMTADEIAQLPAERFKELADAHNDHLELRENAAERVLADSNDPANYPEMMPDLKNGGWRPMTDKELNQEIYRLETIANHPDHEISRGDIRRLEYLQHIETQRLQDANRGEASAALQHPEREVDDLLESLGEIAPVIVMQKGDSHLEGVKEDAITQRLVDEGHLEEKFQKAHALQQATRFVPGINIVTANSRDNVLQEQMDRGFKQAELLTYKDQAGGTIEVPHTYEDRMGSTYDLVAPSSRVIAENAEDRPAERLLTSPLPRPSPFEALLKYDHEDDQERENTLQDRW